MFLSKRNLFWFTSICLCAIFGIFLIYSLTGNAQQKETIQAPEFSHSNIPYKENKIDNKKVKPSLQQALDDAFVPIVDYAASSTSDNKRKKKNMRFDKQGLVTDKETKVTHVSRNSEASISAFPFNLSNLVVEGRVKDSKAYLSNDKTGIYSEFNIEVTDIVKSSGSIAVAKHDIIVTERIGGRVRYPSGHIVRHMVRGSGSLKKNAKYLFFLRQTKDNSYLVITAYEIRGNKIYPLDGYKIRGNNGKERGKSPFEKHRGKNVQKFNKELKEAQNKGEKQ